MLQRQVRKVQAKKQVAMKRKLRGIKRRARMNPIERRAEEEASMKSALEDLLSDLKAEEERIQTRIDRAGAEAEAVARSVARPYPLQLLQEYGIHNAKVSHLRTNPSLLPSFSYDCHLRVIYDAVPEAKWGEALLLRK